MKKAARLLHVLYTSALVLTLGCAHNTTARDGVAIEDKPVSPAQAGSGIQSSDSSWPVVPSEIWRNYNTVQMAIEATVLETGDNSRHGWAKVKIDKILINRSDRKIDATRQLFISYDSYEPVPPVGKCVLFLRSSGDTADSRWFLDRAVNHFNPWEKR